MFQFIGEFIVKVSQVYACLGDESPLNSVAAFRFDIPIESVGRVGDVGLVVELRSEEFSFGVGGVGGRYLHGEDIAVFHGGLPVSSGSNVSIDEAGLHSFSDFGVVGCPEERVVSSRRIGIEIIYTLRQAVGASELVEHSLIGDNRLSSPCLTLVEVFVLLDVVDIARCVFENR